MSSAKTAPTDLQTMLEMHKASLEASRELAKRITALEAGYKELSEVIRLLSASHRELFESQKQSVKAQQTINAAIQKALAALTAEKLKELS
jgi:hypothetical protein